MHVFCTLTDLQAEKVSHIQNSNWYGKSLLNKYPNWSYKKMFYFRQTEVFRDVHWDELCNLKHILYMGTLREDTNHLAL